MHVRGAATRLCPSRGVLEDSTMSMWRDNSGSGTVELSVEFNTDDEPCLVLSTDDFSFEVYCEDPDEIQVLIDRLVHEKELLVNAKEGK